MTEARPQKKARWSRGSLRLLAWVSGTGAFLAVAGLVGTAPKPAAAQAGPPTQRKPLVQRVIVRHIIRRVVIVDPPTHTYSSSGSSSGSGYTGSTSSSSSGGVSVAAPAPAPAPISTGGSPPP